MLKNKLRGGDRRMQFNYKKDLVTVNTSSLCYAITVNNSDLNRVHIEIDDTTGKRMFVLTDYSEDELKSYKQYLSSVKNGTSILVDIIEFNHIYSCLKNMVVEFKVSETNGQKVAGAIRNMQDIFRENEINEILFAKPTKEQLERQEKLQKTFRKIDGIVQRKRVKFDKNNN
jgi:hypothetical protein